MNNFVRLQILFSCFLLLFTIWFNWMFPEDPKPKFISYEQQFFIDPNNKPELSEAGFTKEYVLDTYLKGYPIRQSDEIFLHAWYGNEFTEKYKPVRDSIVRRIQWSDSLHRANMQRLKDYQNRHQLIKKISIEVPTIKKDSLKK